MPVRLSTAAVAAGAAVWLAQGTLAITAEGVRLALLPTSPGALLLSLGAAGLAAGLAWRSQTLAPAALFVLVLLPWLPLPLPAAAFIWSGPLAAFASAAAFVVWLGACGATPRLLVRRVHRHALVAGGIAAAIYAFAAFEVGPSIPGGDEPHYLVITQSLLLDGDLRIENNHARGDYRQYFGGDLKPDYLRRGRDAEIYSIHAPGLPALVAPAFALGGYHGVLLFLIALSALTAALVWHVTHRVTGDLDAAWFAWAAVVFAPTVLLNAFTVYPDGVGALLALSGVWALVRARDDRASGATGAGRWALHGAALALLPWLHTRFALLAGGLGALVLLELARTRNAAGKASAFLAVPAASAAAWIAFFVAIYGAPDPAIPYRGSDLGSPAYIPGGLGGIFFDQMYGLFVYTPVLAAAVAGLVALWRRGGEWRWLPVELLFVLIPYLITVTHFAMWWGGWSAPGRFLLPLVPSLGVAVGAAWASARHPGTRAFLVVLLACTMVMAGITVLVDGGRLAYVSRDTVFSPSLDWLNTLGDLRAGVPAFFAAVRRGWPGQRFFDAIVVWAAAGAVAWLIVRLIGDRPPIRRQSSLAVVAFLVSSAAVMAALTLVWRQQGVTGLIPVSSQGALLRAIARSSSYVALNITARRTIPRGALPSGLSVDAQPAGIAPGVLRGDRPLVTIPPLPAGTYHLTATMRAPGGWLLVGVGPDQFALVSEPADAFAKSLEVIFPVGVRGLFVRGDEDARDRLGMFSVRALRLFDASSTAMAGTARHALRYGDLTTYFMDDDAFPEPGGFWTRGAHAATVVFQTPGPESTFGLRIRNAPIANRLTIAAGAWRETLTLAPGEERRIDVPADSRRAGTAATFDVESGFRPSEVEPGSSDGRFLGVWVSAEPPVADQNLTTPPK